MSKRIIKREEHVETYITLQHLIELLCCVNIKSHFNYSNKKSLLYFAERIRSDLKKAVFFNGVWFTSVSTGQTSRSRGCVNVNNTLTLYVILLLQYYTCFYVYSTIDVLTLCIKSHFHFFSFHTSCLNSVGGSESSSFTVSVVNVTIKK